MQAKRSKKKQPQENFVRNQIIRALMNEKYKARTISGVSKETRLPIQTIISAIRRDKTLAVSLKVYPYRSRDGQILITTKDRFINESTFKERFIDFFSTKRQDLEGLQGLEEVDDAEALDKNA